MSSGNDDFLSTFFIIIALALLLVGVIFVTPFVLLLIAGYIGYRLFVAYQNNPTKKEKEARQLTLEMYEETLRRHTPHKPTWDVPAVYLDVANELLQSEVTLATVPQPPAVCNSIEGARYRDLLSKAGSATPENTDLLVAIIEEALSTLPATTDGSYSVPVAALVDNLHTTVNNLILPFYTGDTFHTLRRALDRNLEEARGVFPNKYKGDDVIEVYLRGTPLQKLFRIRVQFNIPDEVRYEHHHICAGSGHGKTQMLQSFILEDIEHIGEQSVIVIDSQGDLIKNILNLPIDTEKVVLIDPTDIEFPVCLNLFSVGQERLRGYDLLERERLTNSIIELYDFVLGSLLEAGMTQKQNVIFRYLTRLMLHIPDATIHTLRELLTDATPYRAYVEKLSGTPRSFFENEYDSREYAETRKQVLRRLYGILENQTFERMFANPESKVDIFKAMNEGKLILINTAKDLLKENGTQIFGRFFIALIAQAAQERATLSYRRPTFVYIDEAGDYFDQNIGIILSQARKYGVGMVMAHQYLAQMDSKLQEAMDANTSIKMAGGLSQRDARSLAQSLHCDPEFIQSQPKGTFATYVRGHTRRAIPLSFPFGVMEDEATATSENKDRLRQMTRERYATRLSDVVCVAPEPPADADRVEETGEW